MAMKHIQNTIFWAKFGKNPPDKNCQLRNLNGITNLASLQKSPLLQFGNTYQRMHSLDQLPNYGSLQLWITPYMEVLIHNWQNCLVLFLAGK